MVFLNPGLLALLAPLLALPLLIHLLSRRTSRPLYFPSVRHLKVSMTRSAALYRWRHWLLLILRTCLLALLIGAFLHPVLQRHGTVSREAERIVLVMIDHSLSMQHRAGGESADQRARTEAERILGTLGEGDRVNVIRVGPEPVAAAHQPTLDFAKVRQFIRSGDAGVGRADFTRANRRYGTVPLEAETALDIYYVSDFQRADWAGVDFRDLPAEARVFFVDVGAKARGNRGIGKFRLSGESVAAGLVTVEAEVANFSSTPRDETVSLLLDGRPLGEKPVYVAPNTSARIEILLVLPEPGKHLLELRIAGDDLALDDRFHAVVDVDEKEEILLLTSESEAADTAATYLEAALNPYLGASGSIQPRRLTTGRLTAADLAPVTKLFMSHNGPIDADAARLLADFLFAGGSIVWCLDSPDDPGSLAALDEALGEPGVALQLGPWRETDNLSAAHRVIRGEFDSPFLRLFSGTRRQDLGRLEVYDNFAAARTSAGRTLLGFADGSPAMTVQTHGLGQLLLLNFSPHPRLSNLANQRFFPVWIQSIVEAFGDNEARETHYRVGERIVTEVWRDDVRESSFLDPNGDKVSTDIEVLGSRAAVSFTARLPGVYKLVRRDEIRSAFAINPPSEESDLRPVPMESLPQREGTPQRAALVDTATEDLQSASLGKPVFHWFVGGALLFACLELVLHWLIRRHTPSVVPDAS